MPIIYSLIVSIPIIYSLIVSILALIFTYFIIQRIISIPVKQGKMAKVAQAIDQGAQAFLKREFKVMIPVFVLAGLGFIILTGQFFPALIFFIGAGFSLLAGYIGMRVSTKANVRVTDAAQKSFPRSFQIAFWGGEVMGFLVVGLGLLGISLVWLVFQDYNLLIYFAFGASLIALFMRVGGGIFTKSADVGADLVGKVEKNIPEDDPRNPAVIADQVGDNVGDIAGMGSDLFESYVATIIAAMVIGVVQWGIRGLFLPLILASAGILSSIISSLFITISKGIEKKDFSFQTNIVRKAMEKGVIIANVLMLIAAYFIITRSFGEAVLFYVILIGLGMGFLIGKVTEYYTSEKHSPVLNIARAAQTGAPNVIIQGLMVGMKSTAIPIIGVAIAIILAYHFGELYGIALASVGILGVLGINLSTDCYGPIVDNAAGIAEMAELPKDTRQRAEALDAVGNSTAAAGKGFAIGAAALAALAWLATYFQMAGLEMVNLLDPRLLAGLFLGAMIVFVFASFLMGSVGKGALEVVKEVRRQFKEIPGLMAGKATPDYEKCVDIITKKSLKEMILPAVVAVATPLVVGLFLGTYALAGVLAGTLITGFPLALFFANSGGAWDNAKKYIEAGNLGGKGTDVHKNAVIGDTVGDPFKDTAGPSINILIKLIGVASLILLPLFL